MGKEPPSTRLIFLGFAEQRCFGLGEEHDFFTGPRAEIHLDVETLVRIHGFRVVPFLLVLPHGQPLLTVCLHKFRILRGT